MKANIYFCNISFISSWNEKRFRQSCRENQNTHFVLLNFFVSKIVPFVTNSLSTCMLRATG